MRLETAWAVLVAVLAAATALAFTLLDATWAQLGLAACLLVLAPALAYAASAGPGAFRVGAAMLRRTLLTYRSYRVQLVSTLLWTSLTLLLLFFAAGSIFRLFVGGEGGFMSGEIVALLAVGITTFPLFWKAWEAPAVGVRQEQWEGTLEANVPMPNGTRSLPVGYLMSRVPITLLFQTLCLAAIALAIPGALRLASPAAALQFFAVVVLTLVCMWGLGLLFGGLAILYKQIGPADLVVRTLFVFLAGAFFPLSVFPAWARALAELLPLTHTYRLLQHVAVDGGNVADAPIALVALIGWTALAVLAGTLTYRTHVDKARRRGAVQGY